MPSPTPVPERGQVDEEKTKLPVCVLHGAWLPDASGGEFRVWAESVRDCPRKISEGHPFRVPGTDLAEVLAATWPSPARTAGATLEAGSTAWVALPGDGERPSPSLELQAELEDDDVNPATGMGAWRVDTVKIDDPMDFLARPEPRIQAQGTVVRIGHDLRFWRALAERLQSAVRRHDYLPSIWAGSVPSTQGGPAKRRKRKATKPNARFKAAWELAETAEEQIVSPFAMAMPVACRAMRDEDPRSNGSGGALYEPSALIRHFLEFHLQRLVREAKLTQSIFGRLEHTFVEHAVANPRAPRDDDYHPAIDSAVWTQWRRWRDRIQRAGLKADERICFRLTDAVPDEPDAWRLEWLLASRRDPSLLVPLAEFWEAEGASAPSPESVQEVLIQLGQAARIYSKLWDGMGSEAPAEVVLNRDEALEFLRSHAPVMQGAGFRVIVPAWWTATGQRRLRLRLTARGSSESQGAGSVSSGIFGFESLVQFEPQVLLDGEPLTSKEWKDIVAAKEGLVELRGQWMELQADEVARLEEYWDSSSTPQTMTVGDLFRAEAAAGADGFEIAHEGDLGRTLAALRGTGHLEMLPQPDSFSGELRTYQVRGFSWLSYLEGLGFGACLADDMGLGKTIQVIATVLADKLRNPDAGPTLLIAPTSVLGNWQRETRRFAPELSTCIQHGSQRAKTLPEFKAAISGMDFVIVSFGGARQDAEIHKKVRWRRLVVDESQNIKNPAAAVTKAIRGIRAERRIALTGTPVENRLTDLWSLFSVLNPGYLGTVAEFRKKFEKPIMKEGERATAERLRSLVRPFILRRMKTDKAIIKDLPDKLEQNSFCNLTLEQATLYEAVVRDMEAKLEAEEGIARLGLVLSTLTKLKQICNHPAQFLQDASEFSATRSHKLARVCEMLDEIAAERESALVFTQFTEIGRALEALFLQRYGGTVYYLHGGTPRARREHMVEEFQRPDSDPSIFVLSLRAGGTGITLTRANHVIHFDRWWNPAVENQATDRAYRIGQTKTVFVHKMVTMGTLEERIDELIESKKKLADDIVGSDESWLASLDNETFRGLVSLDSGSAVVN